MVKDRRDKILYNIDMKINKKLSFGVTVVAVLLTGFYLQGQIGNKKVVDKFFGELGTKAEELITINYPKDLIVKVEKGQVAINKKLPYCLLLDKENNMGLVFDGSESLNINAFSEQPKNFSCKPFAIVGKNFVGGKKDDGEIRAWQVPSEVTVEINQKMLLDGKDKYLPLVKTQGKKLYSILPFVLAVAILPLIMLFNFWYSLAVYLLAKLFKLTTHPEIKNRYWIALFFESILSIINTLLSYTLYPQISFAFSGTIIIGAASILYLKYLSKPVVEDEIISEIKVKKVVKKKK